MEKLYKKLMNFFSAKYFKHVAEEYNQTTFVFCPKCGLELCHSDSFIEDTDLVRYKCVNCKHHSSWLFDAPIPMLIEEKEFS